MSPLTARTLVVLLAALPTLAACEEAPKALDTGGLVGAGGGEDADGDGFPAGEDCNDGDAAMNPAAVETCNGVDDNCDGEVDEGLGQAWYADRDADGHGDPDSMVEACAQPADHVPTSTDCDDSDPEVNPGAAEACNEVDDDCDGEVDEDVGDTFWLDGDGDGFGDPGAELQACALPDGAADNADDCDDGDAAVSPDATEVCNEVDDDCDGDTDEGVTSTYYEDRDADGYGALDTTTEACALPTGYAPVAGDCDDGAAAVHPDADEACNSIDDDCDGLVDDADTDQPVVGASTWHGDGDGDGYGDAATTLAACVQPSGHVADATDCDDAAAAVNPGAAEVCNSIDDDCDGAIDDDDTGITGQPTWYIDYDSDGYGASAFTLDACVQPSGYVSDATDCDDTSASVHPGAAEICNDLDDDCDALVDQADPDGPSASSWYADSDGDGYGDAASTVSDCDAPSGHVADATDCDDSSASVNPGAAEVCNSIDDDCDTLVDSDDPDGPATSTWYLDDDSDGYGDAASSTEACAQPANHVSDATDCDDRDLWINPGAAELCNDTDDDCDGETDEALIGASASCPAESCAELLFAWSGAADGDHYLDPDGLGASLYTCDMTTDGGGWTRIVQFDRENDGDSKSDFLGEFTVLKNNMSTFKEGSTYLHWRDENASGQAHADVISLEAEVVVPNDGEILYNVDYEGVSMEESATYFWADVGGTDTNLECWDGVSSWSPYSSSEKAERASYTCSTTYSSTGSKNFAWSGPTQDDLGSELDALRFASFHYDSCCDYSYLYAFEVWVR
jgi:hypothetical protein